MNILLIGCGHMGAAMLGGWTKGQTAKSIDVVDPHANIQTDTTITHFFKNINDLPDIHEYDVAVLAVKPQIMGDVCHALADTRYANLVLSIAAGWSTAKIADPFATAPAIIRTMPNMPAAIGQGMLLSYANTHVTAAQQTMAEQLLSPLGKHLWIDNEDLMHAVTALSGSGPAYIFALTQAMHQAGMAIGLPDEIAAALARQTVIGSAAYMGQSPKDAQTLIDMIAVAGGTTEAAMVQLNDKDAITALFTDALTAARDKSIDLGS